VCCRGHLNVAAWLAEIGLDGQGPPKQNGLEGFDRACSGGQLEVAQWLAGRYEIGKKDIASPGGLAHPLCLAAAGGHLAVVRWLIARYALAPGDVTADDYEVLKAACRCGRLAAAEWLHTNYAATKPQLRSIILFTGGAGQKWAQSKLPDG
jgi:hypothetical protein